MTTKRIIELLEIEYECMCRKSQNKCNGRCEECDLVQDDKELREMYVSVISELKSRQPSPALFIEPIRFDQNDKRWSAKPYSNHNDPHQTIGSSGSALALCASVVATLKDESVNPLILAQLSVDWGCRRYNSGTSWDFFKRVAAHYGFSRFVQTKNLDVLKNCLDSGGYAICSMKRGYWTSVGNYILAWMYDDKSIYANGSERKRGKQSIKDFWEDSNMYFCFYPDVTRSQEQTE